MDNNNLKVLGEIAFYTAVAGLIVLFLVKKYRQVKNIEKDKPNHNE